MLLEKFYKKTERYLEISYLGLASPTTARQLSQDLTYFEQRIENELHALFRARIIPERVVDSNDILVTVDPDMDLYLLYELPDRLSDSHGNLEDWFKVRGYKEFL